MPSVKKQAWYNLQKSPKSNTKLISRTQLTLFKNINLTIDWLINWFVLFYISILFLFCVTMFVSVYEVEEEIPPNKLIKAENVKSKKFHGVIKIERCKNWTTNLILKLAKEKSVKIKKKILNIFPESWDFEQFIDLNLRMYSLYLCLFKKT